MIYAYNGQLILSNHSQQKNPDSRLYLFSLQCWLTPALREWTDFGK